MPEGHVRRLGSRSHSRLDVIGREPAAIEALGNVEPATEPHVEQRDVRITGSM
jgi:hypothetical protein